MTALAGFETSDAELVDLAKSGDRDAFRQLFVRHSPRVAAACRSKLRSKPDVDDAVQEAFARALAHIDQLRDPAQFGAWVRQIAVRACVDHHRVARRVIVVDDETHAERADSAPLPDEVVEAADRDASVQRLLQLLGERDRQALYLRHITEAGVPQIAAELGLTEGSTRVMLTRARERLRSVATGLGGLIPWHWRRWFRDHLPAATPALEALAVVVAVGVAGGFSPPAADATPAIVVESAGAEAKPTKVRSAARRAASAQAQQVPRRGATQERVAPPAPAPAADVADEPERRQVLTRVKDTVTVKREYPKDEETDELLDLTVFSNQEENTFRLYGNEVTDASQPTTEAARELVGGEE